MSKGDVSGVDLGRAALDSAKKNDSVPVKKTKRRIVTLARRDRVGPLGRYMIFSFLRTPA